MKHLKSYRVFENEERLSGSAASKLMRLLELGMITNKEYVEGVIENSQREYSSAEVQCELDLYWILQSTPAETKAAVINHLNESNLMQSDILVYLDTVWVDEWNEEDADYVRTLDSPGSGMMFGFTIAYSTSREEVETWAEDFVGRIAFDVKIQF